MRMIKYQSQRRPLMAAFVFVTLCVLSFTFWSKNVCDAVEVGVLTVEQLSEEDAPYSTDEVATIDESVIFPEIQLLQYQYSIDFWGTKNSFDKKVEEVTRVLRVALRDTSDISLHFAYFQTGGDGWFFSHSVTASVRVFAAAEVEAEYQTILATKQQLIQTLAETIEDLFENNPLFHNVLLTVSPHKPFSFSFEIHWEGEDERETEYELLAGAIEQAMQEDTCTGYEWSCSFQHNDSYVSLVSECKTNEEWHPIYESLIQELQAAGLNFTLRPDLDE